MGEAGREVREVDGRTTTFCSYHGVALEWMEVSPGRSRFTCPGCEARTYVGEPGPKTPLIRYGQTYWRDRPLTDKEKANRPKARSI